MSRREGDNQSDLLREQEAADYCGLPYWTFRRLRTDYGGGPAYVKLGRRLYYHRSELDRWLAKLAEGKSDD